MLGTLIKGIKVLELFTVNRPRWRITEISHELGINKTGVFRIVETLEQEGYLRKDPQDRTYCLTPKLLGLSTVVLSQFNIVEQSKASIDRLWAATQGTVVLRIFEGRQLITVAVRESPHVLRVAHNVGTRYDLNYGAIGKAILAHLPEEELENILKRGSFKKFTSKTLISASPLLEELQKIRRVGYAFSDEEAIDGVRAVGAPIFDVSGKPIAGISVGLPSVRFPKNKVVELGQRVRAAASQISVNLGFQRHMVANK